MVLIAADNFQKFIFWGPGNGITWVIWSRNWLVTKNQDASFLFVTCGRVFGNFVYYPFLISVNMLFIVCLNDRQHLLSGQGDLPEVVWLAWMRTWLTWTSLTDLNKRDWPEREPGLPEQVWLMWTSLTDLNKRDLCEQAWLTWTSVTYVNKPGWPEREPGLPEQAWLTWTSLTYLNKPDLLLAVTLSH